MQKTPRSRSWWLVWRIWHRSGPSWLPRKGRSLSLVRFPSLSHVYWVAEEIRDRGRSGVCVGKGGRSAVHCAACSERIPGPTDVCRVWQHVLPRSRRYQLRRSCLGFDLIVFRCCSGWARVCLGRVQSRTGCRRRCPGLSRTDPHYSESSLPSPIFIRSRC
jgi:hypothetical protein